MTVDELTAQEVAPSPAPKSQEGRPGAAYLVMVLLPIGVILLLLLRHGGHATAATGGSVDRPGAEPAHLMLIGVTLIVGLAGLLGLLCRLLDQSPVIGETIGGLLLGPSLFGWLAPGLQHRIFTPPVTTQVSVVAQLGVVFFMFLIGLEVPLTVLQRVRRAALPIGHAAIAVPFAMGVGLGMVFLDKFRSPTTPRLPFLLFIGLSVSVTAFPVLARILSHRRMLDTRTGAMGLAVAGIGDVTAWCVLGLVVAEARNSSQLGALLNLAQLAVFGALLWFVLRPALERAVRWLEGTGPESLACGAAIAAYICCCALLTDALGVHAIFGAVLAGLSMPRSSPVVAEFGRRIEGLVVWLLLPLFFATIGLQTDLRDLFVGGTTIPLVAVLVVAVVGKLGATACAARVCGERWPTALTLGVMMNCRGLTELVVLNVGISLGIFDSRLFSILVVMTLLTTLMTDPLLRSRWVQSAPSPDEPLTATRQTLAPGVTRNGGLVDAASLRAVCGLFVTGVAVVTCGDQESSSGTTVNSFTSVSLDPPLVLFCLHRQSRLVAMISTHQAFVVNLLSSAQQRTAWAFAGRRTADLDTVAHRHTADGQPVLNGAVAHLACRVVNQYDGGDHLIVLGEVHEVSTAVPGREPLIFFRGAMGGLEDDRLSGHSIWDG